MPPHGGRIELHDTPFFPQTAYQCGPAALATVLNATGAVVSPQALTGQVYVPAKKGSLQVEMLAATRRAGRIPYRIEPSLSALRAELDANRPVLVLQNLGLRALPVWHYAVVIGMDPADDTLILRSGTRRRERTQAHDFLRSWRLAEHWAVVVLRPGELPARAAATRLLAATATAEPLLSTDARRLAYHAALDRWPMNTTARFGYALALHATGELTAAERQYRRIIARQPRHAAALNNLAEVQADRGCRDMAIATAQQALAIANAEQPALVVPIRTTLEALNATAADRHTCQSVNDGKRAP